MKLFNEPYFNRRNWILDNAENLQLSLEETMLVLYIDYLNEFKPIVDIATLSQKMKWDKQKVDLLMNELMKKNYLKVDVIDRKMVYNIEGVFQQTNDGKPCDNSVYTNLFALYEQEFARPLSQKESEMLSEWLTVYDIKLIEYALREAITYNSMNMHYIDKILVHWKEKNITAQMYEEGRQ